MEVVLVHYGELWLRGKNRPYYIRLLKKSIAEKLAGLDYAIADKYDRLAISADPKLFEEICSRLSTVFGISNYAIAGVAKPELKEILLLSRKYFAELKKGGAKSVKINSHRAFKGLEFDSMDIIRKAAAIAEKLGLKPETKGNDSSLFINVTKDASYIYTKPVKGLGGLPPGSSGRAIVLLSGGIDSPVAAWYAMKRGITPIYLHAHGFKTNSEAQNSKIGRLIGVLDGYSRSYASYYVPAYKFQIAAMGHSARYEAVLFKAFMLRMAERIAALEHADAIYTGESLGQVASQTAKNMAASQQGVRLPIMRPLVGLDKEEIIAVARRIGTYDISIEPYKDVCSINASHPTTAANPNAVKDMLNEMHIGRIVRESLKLASISRQAST